MDERTQKRFKQIIRERFGVDSIYVRTDQVDIVQEGQPSWAGPVHIFKLEQHPDSTYCYAWDELHPAGHGQHRTATIPDQGKDMSAKQAVELSIFLSRRGGAGGSP